MIDFDALLCAIAANPHDDTPKLALSDYCREELRSDELADLVVAKLDLMAYKPHPGPMNNPVRNQLQAAEDLRRKIKQCEEDMLEDGLDKELKAIEQTFILVVWLKASPLGRRLDETRLAMEDMGKIMKFHWEPAVEAIDLEEWETDIDDNPAVNGGLPAPSLYPARPNWQDYATSYTDVDRDSLLRRMREAAATQEMNPVLDRAPVMFRGIPVVTVPQLEESFNFITSDRRRHFVLSPGDTDALAGSVPPPGSD